MTRRKDWDPERMKPLRLRGTRKWAATKRPELSTYHKQHYSVMLRTGKKISGEAVKPKLGGRK
jgi:hypothetical protein